MRAKRRWMCPFPLAHPSVCSLEITANSLGSSQAYVYIANRAVLTAVPAAHRLQGTAASVSQAGPPTGAAAVGVLGQEMHLCPPSLAREALPRGAAKGRGASCSTEGALSFSRGVSSAC